MTIFRATVKNSIFWNGKSYRTGDPINLSPEDKEKLVQADVIGNVRDAKQRDIEFGVRKAPENTKRPYKKRKSQ